jgi:hypothetical protein
MTSSCFDGRLASGLRFRVRKQLDRRPKLIDQPAAIADFPAFLDTGQSVRSGVCMQSGYRNPRIPSLLSRW